MRPPRSSSFIVDESQRLNISSFAPYIREYFKQAEEQNLAPPQPYSILTFTCNNTKYRAALSLRYEYESEDEKGIKWLYFLNSVSFTWRNEEGERCAQTISFFEEYSNLGLRSYYYFICPITGAHCRHLYPTSRGKFVSRKALRAHYSSEYRYLSKQPLFRILSLLDSAGEDPYRKGGKPYYRGKLTPYGKKLLKYKAKEEQLLKYMQGQV